MASVPPATEKERAMQREYWEEHSKKQGSSMENMMLDRSAAKLDLMDRPEILSLLPPFAGTRILELASGIGRFTGSLAIKAASVVTVEFMKEFLAKNKELHDHLGNCEFICSDVLTLALPPASFDVVFSCWIQMYLNDDEVRSLAARTLEWVKPGGHAFFRESCFRQSGDVSRAFNPSHYRHPSFYTLVFSQVRCRDPADGVEYGLELVRTRNLETYVAVKGNKGQICWLWRKVPVVASSTDSVPIPVAGASTNSPGYSPIPPASALSMPYPNGSSSCGSSSSSSSQQPNALLAAPATGRLATHDGLFGAGFGSDRLGGAGPAAALAEALKLDGPGKKVVDWQCGMGGYGLYVAEKCGAQVWQVEERTALVEPAVENAMTKPNAYTVLEVCSLESREFDAGSVDAVLLHTSQPSPLASASTSSLSFYKRAAEWLKPGGCVVAGLVVGSEEEAETIKAAMKQALGGEVAMTDMTPQMLEWVGKDLQAFKSSSSNSGSSNGSCNGSSSSDGRSLNEDGCPAGAAGAEARSADVGIREQGEKEVNAAVGKWWEEQLAQTKAGTVRYVVCKALKQH